MTLPPSSTSRDSVPLQDILRSARLALSYIDGMDWPAFQNDMKTQDAVLYRITVIGEAARRVSETLRNEHPGLPWREMQGMRNIVVHEYTRVRLIRVWEVVTRDLPVLIEQVQQLVPPPDATG